MNKYKIILSDGSNIVISNERNIEEFVEEVLSFPFISFNGKIAIQADKIIMVKKLEEVDE